MPGTATAALESVTFHSQANSAEISLAHRTAVEPRSGLVRLQDRSFHDAGGPFLGLGVSYFQALHDAKFDRERLNQNLTLLAAKGFNFVRVLSMVSWEGLEIAPVNFTNRFGRGVAAWPDYWHQFRDLLDLADRRHLRVELTVFADAQYVMPSETARRGHLAQILTSIAGRESQLMFLEVANEAWQNGFPGVGGAEQLRAFARYLSERTQVLVAITSTEDTSNPGIISLYDQSAADLATIHFTRDTKTIEGGWLPVRDCYRAGRLNGVPPVVSNEPIGPGSSVNSESDPVKLCSAAVFAYLANLPGYVFHSRAGIYGWTRCCPPSGGRLRFEETPGLDAFGHLVQLLPPDMSSWKRNDGLESDAPFTVYCTALPNRYWPGIKGAVDGCAANIGGVKGPRFISLAVGLLQAGATFEARRSLQVEAIDPMTGDIATNLTLAAGARFRLPQGSGAYLLKGSFGSFSNPNR